MKEMIVVWKEYIAVQNTGGVYKMGIKIKKTKKILKLKT